MKSKMKQNLLQRNQELSQQVEQIKKKKPYLQKEET